MITIHRICRKCGIKFTFTTPVDKWPTKCQDCRIER